MLLFERRRGETIVVDVHGPVGPEQGDLPALLARLRALTNHGCTDIVLNVEELSHIDSLIVGTIAHAYISASRAGATLRLLHVPPELRKLLATTKLDRVIGVVDDDNLKSAI
jgi:anti-anti-sigma factor